MEFELPKNLHVISSISRHNWCTFSLLLASCWLVGSTRAQTADAPIIQKCSVKSISPALRRDTVRIPSVYMWNHKHSIFRLKAHELNCELGHSEVLMQTNGINKTTATVFTVDKDGDEDSRAEHFFSLTATGYLRLGNEYFHPDDYCLYQVGGLQLTAYVCNPQCNENRPCIQKCCGLTQYWDIAEQACKDTNGTADSDVKYSLWKPTFYSQVRSDCVLKVSDTNAQNIHAHVKSGLPDCFPKKIRAFSRYKIKDVINERFRMLQNGTLISKDHHGGWNLILPSYYCVDAVQDSFDPKFSDNFDYDDQIVLACEGEFTSKILKKPIALRYAAILLAASGFLLFTTIIFLLLWDKHNIYNWTIFCEVIAMLFMIFFVGIAHTFARKPDSDDYGSLHCRFIGAIAHFFYLSTFFWLTMINFDLWWTFRVLKPTKSKGWFRFSIYQLFGWGIPSVIVVVGWILDCYYGIQNEDMDCSNIVTPNYGQLNCYLSKAAQGPYLYYPIGILLGGNLIFFIMTVVTVNGYRKSTQSVIRGRSTMAAGKPVAVFAKLFIVMGVSWIFELLSWTLHVRRTLGKSSKVPWYWIIFDVVTLMQAFAIFYMFVCKRQVLSHLWHKYPSCKPFLAPLTRLPCCGLMPQDSHITMRQRNSKLPSSENLTIPMT